MKIIGVIILINLGVSLFAQSDTLVLSRQEAETLFLEKNYDLLIHRLNIDKAEAEVIQAKLWPNPSFSIGEVNLWRNGEKHLETQPYLLGKWGESTQIALEVEQLVQTASKRKKLIEVEKVNQEISTVYLEELLRNLKFEFRSNLTELQYLQRKATLYQQLSQQLERLIQGFKTQLQQKNISKAEVVRLQSLQIQFSKQINEIQIEKNEIIKELKVLMVLPSEVYLVLNQDEFDLNSNQLEELQQLDLVSLALENRSDYRINQLEGEYFQKKLTYEKSLRVPDLNFSINYDRGGGIMRDFVGFGVSFDLPFFDRNQGNIKLAQIEIDQNSMEQQQKRIEIQSEVKKQLDIFTHTQKQFSSLDSDFESDLEQLLPAYRQNFINRNINLVEYIDFIESYIESKEILLEYRKTLRTQFEEIQYIIGKEI